jgi:hypothetical protein
MLDILAKFKLKIQMTNDECGDVNKLELTANDGYTITYSKIVDFDFKNLLNLSSEDILEIFDLTILIEIEDCTINIQNDRNMDCQKRTMFTLKDGKKHISKYYHQVITIPQNERIINNTPSSDAYSVITLTYL